MLSFSERFIQQGRQQGHQLGVQEGGAQLLLRQLRLKFGELPTGVREKVETADSETLLQWSDRILSANSLEEVFEDNT